MHAKTCKYMKQSCAITCKIMESRFDSRRLSLIPVDACTIHVQEMLAECNDYINKSLRPKRAPISPGVILRAEDCPHLGDALKHKYRA